VSEPILLQGNSDPISAESKLYGEDDLVMISALQHLLFCPRQCALIHIEQQWAENRFTTEGRILHEKVDIAGTESRGRIRTVFGLPIRSFRYGLSGRADAVEFHLKDDEAANTPFWRPFPVEYKRGNQRTTTWIWSSSAPRHFVWRRCLVVTCRKGQFITASHDDVRQSRLTLLCEAKP